MARKRKPQGKEVEEPAEEEEETYSQYDFSGATINITAGNNCQINVGVGKPQPFPPPNG